MALISKSILGQRLFVHQALRLSNVVKQTSSPFSVTSRHFEDQTSQQKKNGNQSFDSVPIHLTSGGKVIMVLGGLYSRYGDVPDSIPNRVYQKTKDKFRARCVIFSVFGTGLLAFIAARRGKKARDEGKRYTDDVYAMHRGQSMLHDRIEHPSKHRSESKHHSTSIAEINK